MVEGSAGHVGLPSDETVGSAASECPRLSR
jgi:hypothetical protein